MDKSQFIFFTGCFVFALSGSSEAAVMIENTLYTVSVEVTDGSFAIVSKPSGKTIMPAIREAMHS